MTVLALGVIYSKGMEYVGLSLSGRQKNRGGPDRTPSMGKFFDFNDDYWCHRLKPS